MTKPDSGVEVGRLNDRVEVLGLAAATDESGTTHTWETVRRTWAKAELMARSNIYSVHGIGAAGVTFTLRRQPLGLDNALQWHEQHCLITSIRSLGRLYLAVEAALVVLSQCEDRYTGTKFPAVMTERYLSHQQLEPLAINTLRHVLVTPKCIQLEPGRLVEADGVSWPIRVAHLLDPHKNEYELERTVDL